MTAHGGSRPGGGRPPKPPGTKLVRVSVQFPPELLAELKATAKARGVSTSAMIKARCTYVSIPADDKAIP